MDCSTCANCIRNYNCRSMKRKPKNKWCYVTPNQAVQAEKAVIAYMDKCMDTASDRDADKGA
jgi:TPP-dependent indolepyruvate ferredoxin oxidoreductase alpha subunit